MMYHLTMIFPQSIDDLPLSQTKPNELQDNPISLSSYLEYQNVPHYAGSLSMQKSPNSSHFSPHAYSDHGQFSQHYTSHHSQHKDNCDQIPLRFTIGMLVQTNSRGGSPIRGVIQWIGLLQYYNEYFAGIELVSANLHNDIHAYMYNFIVCVLVLF